jgi:hypothetical protein
MDARRQNRAGSGRAGALRPFIPWLLLAGALSVAGMVLGAGRGDRLLAASAAGLFATAITAIALWINAPVVLRPAADADGEAAAAAVACNVWLAAFVYAWGASALLAVYTLSDLAWRHGWQYSLGAAIFAVGLAMVAASLDRAEGTKLPPLYLTALHGFAAVGGLVYLVAEGKLATLRGDWAANNVFVAGGLAIIALCVIAAITQTRNPWRPG